MNIFASSKDSEFLLLLRIFKKSERRQNEVENIVFLLIPKHLSSTKDHLSTAFSFKTDFFPNLDCIRLLPS